MPWNKSRQVFYPQICVHPLYDLEEGQVLEGRGFYCLCYQVVMRKSLSRLKWKPLWWVVIICVFHLVPNATFLCHNAPIYCKCSSLVPGSFSSTAKISHWAESESLQRLRQTGNKTTIEFIIETSLFNRSFLFLWLFSSSVPTHQKS